MALTVDQLRRAVRAGETIGETEILTRLLAVGTAHVERYAPGAPEPVQDEAVARVAGYLFDQPNAGRGVAYASALRNSGAASLLLPWRVHRAGSIGEAAAAAAEGPADEPAAGEGLSTAEVDARVRAGVEDWAEAGNADPIPAGKLGAAAAADPYVLPAATSGVRGGVRAVTNAIIDAGSSTGIFGWAISHVRRLATSIVATWARDGNSTPIPASKLANAPSSPYLGAYDALSETQQRTVELGQITLRYARFWICQDRTRARLFGPLESSNDGWRAIDGQYRGLATVVEREYDTADHVLHPDGSLYFCVGFGSYTSAQISNSVAWINLSADREARAAAAAAMAAVAGLVSGGTARTEVLVPFRPGARPGAVLIESAGYVVGGSFTKYVSPHYVAAAGGFTVAVDDAYDFANEPHLVALLAGGGGGGAPITAPPDAPTVEGLAGIYRDGNAITTVSSRPSSTITLHFVENVGGSRFFNPDDRVARFPHGGAATPDFNEGHQWIAGIAILAVGNEKRIELITDGDQPAGTFRVSFAVPGGAAVEHLVVPLVADPGAYHSGLVSNIPDGADLEFSITVNGQPRILHAGLHFERFILAEELEARVVPLQQRIAELEAVGGATDTQIGETVSVTQTQVFVAFSDATFAAFIAEFERYHSFLIEIRWGSGTSARNLFTRSLPRRIPLPDSPVTFRWQFAMADALGGDPAGEAQEVYLELRRGGHGDQLILNAPASSGGPFRDGMAVSLYGVT